MIVPMLAPPLLRRGQFRAPAHIPSGRQSCPVCGSPKLKIGPSLATSSFSLATEWVRLIALPRSYWLQVVTAGLLWTGSPTSAQMGTTTVDPTSFVTDSAAAATAIATGVKTLNGSVSIDLKGQERTTILELAKASGRSVGIGQHLPNYRRDAGGLRRARAAPRRPERGRTPVHRTHRGRCHSGRRRRSLVPMMVRRCRNPHCRFAMSRNRVRRRSRRDGAPDSGTNS